MQGSPDDEFQEYPTSIFCSVDDAGKVATGTGSLAAYWQLACTNTFVIIN